MSQLSAEQKLTQLMSADFLAQDKRLSWMSNPDIRPYVLVRPENAIHRPGIYHYDLHWFNHLSPIYVNPLEMKSINFANSILHLESRAFGPSGMAMPRWVFYDCAVMPGFVAGFAARTNSLSPQLLKVLQPIDLSLEWTPLSLFIVIPTMSMQGEWVAHNLSSVNVLLSKQDQFYGIGFLTKAFGLWYGNIHLCCGMTQWESPSVRIHSHYGDFEILTAYTPVHSYARTLTYRVVVDPQFWPEFFTRSGRDLFYQRYEYANFDVDPQQDQSLTDFQARLESGQGPFFIDAHESRSKETASSLRIYRPRPTQAEASRYGT